MGELRVDLACGQNKEEGWVGIDLVAAPGVDIVHNLLEAPWPLEDDSVDEARCIHFVEHIPMRCAGACCEGQPDPFLAFLDELWRVLKPGATCLVIAPYWSSMRAWQDPTHRRAISEASFLYGNKGWRETSKLDHYDVHCDFDFTYGYVLDPSLGVRAEDYRTFAVRNFLNSVTDIQVTLTKRAHESAQSARDPKEG